MSMMEGQGEQEYKTVSMMEEVSTAMMEQEQEYEMKEMVEEEPKGSCLVNCYVRAPEHIIA